MLQIKECCESGCCKAVHCSRARSGDWSCSGRIASCTHLSHLELVPVHDVGRGALACVTVVTVNQNPVTVFGFAGLNLFEVVWEAGSKFEQVSVLFIRQVKEWSTKMSACCRISVNSCGSNWQKVPSDV